MRRMKLKTLLERENCWIQMDLDEERGKLRLDSRKRKRNWVK